MDRQDLFKDGLYYVYFVDKEGNPLIQSRLPIIGSSDSEKKPLDSI